MGKKKTMASPEKSKSSPPKKVKINESENMDTSDSGSEFAPGQAPGALQAAPDAAPPDWFLHYMRNFERRLEGKIQNMVAAQMFDLAEKVKNNEEKLNAMSIKMVEMDKEVKSLREVNKDLEKKLDDMENRSRRNNLVYYNVPENPNASTSDVVKELLDFIGVPADDRCIERCHRTPSHPQTTADGSPPRPRMIHINFNSFKTKESVRRASVKKFMSQQYKGEKLFVSDDFSKKVMMQRKNKKELLGRLKEEGKRPFFLFPAKVAYNDSSGKLHIVG